MSRADTLASYGAFKHTVLRQLLRSFWDLLPDGGSLPADVWQKRHRFLLGLTWFHALLIALIGPVVGYSWELSLAAFFREDTVVHTMTEGLVVAFFASVAAWWTTRRSIRATAVGLGLMSASAILVHLSGGYIELHFHFFVMLTFLALYQDWVPYLLAIAYVAIHHGVIGVLSPQDVYNHAAAIDAPFTWAGIHAFFVLWAAVGSVIAWRFNEKAFAQTKLILDSVGEGIFGLDRAGKVTFINPIAASLLQWNHKETIGQALHQVLCHTRRDGTDFSDPTSPILAALRDGARYQSTDELFGRKDRTSFPVDYVCTPIFEREQITGLVVTFTDITRRRRRELALRESEERFRQIAENIKEVFWVTDPLKNEKLYVSPAYREIWGRDPLGSDSLSKSWLGSIVPEDLGRVLASVAAKQAAGEYDEEYRIVRPDGSLRWVRDRAFPVRDHSGKVYRIIGVAEDITEHKRTADELQSGYEELAIIHDVSQMILTSTDLNPVLEKVLDRALGVLSLDIGNIRLFDPSRHVQMGAYQGYRNPENGHNHQANRTGAESGRFIPQLIASGKSVVVEDITTVEKGFRTFKKEGVSSAIVLPIVVGDETFGIIEVGSRAPCKFRPSDVRLLEAIANQLGLGVQKARLLYETWRRAQEQGALNIVAKNITQSLRRDELLQIALDKALEVTGRERVSIRLKDPLTGCVQLAAHRGFSREEINDLLQMTPHQATEKVLASGRPVVLHNREESHPAQPLLPQTRSVAWIPMKAGAEVVGILGISASSPLPFAEREIEFLQAIANMIGMALEHARLFSETEARYRELQTLHAISDTILDSLDLKIMMERILDKAFLIGGFDIGLVRFWDPARETLEPVASRGYRESRNLDEHRKSTKDGSTARIIAQVIATKEIKVEDLTEVEGMRTFRREGVRSVVTVPLRTQQEVLGVIHLGSRTQRDYQPSELRILDAIGGQAGIAIQKVRLYEDAKRAQTALEKKAKELTELNADLQSSAQEIKMGKERLERANSILTTQAAELARSNAELEQFAFIASHDLQEPLRMVASYVQLLARRYQGRLDAEADEFIGFAVDGSKRMQNLIQALLAYSRVGSKGKKFERTDCALVLQSALGNLQMAIHDSQARITHDPLPAVMGDATQLEQLFQNLIGNAIKFRGDKPAAVHVSAERNQAQWVFSFHDDGIGIDPQYSERIFVIFQRLHSKEEYPGTGIGLALCKKIVERHGGRIWLESELGNGSTFHFTMPA